MSLCRWLRWKSFYAAEDFTDDELRDIFARNEVPYTCLRNDQPFGDDGDVCAPEACTRERACFEMSGKLIRRVG